MSLSPLPRVLVPHPHVRIDAAILSGSPHVVGSKVPVRRLWAWHKAGTSVETLCRRYPNLGFSKILDALSFAYDNVELIQADIEREQALFAEKGKPEEDPSRPLSQLALPFNAAGAPAPRRKRP
ncbi:MAG: DUF433 domain-containing protein [Polyangiaceae bacterium]